MLWAIHALGQVFFSVAVAKRNAVANVHRPAVAVLVPKPILLRQTTERSGMIINAYHIPCEVLGNIVWNPLRDELIVSWQLDAPPAPILRNSPWTAF